MKCERSEADAFEVDHEVPDAGAPKSLKNSGPSVRAEVLRGVRELVTALGGDAAALLRKSQIEPALLDAATGVFPYRHWVQLLERAAAELACPDFGLRLAAAQAAAGAATKILGPLDLAMRHSPTLGHAFRYCAEHIHCYTAAAQICFEKLPDDPRVFMLFEILQSRLPQQRQAVEHALALSQHATVAFSGGQARAREIWFTHEPLAPLSAYRAAFNTAVRFGQSMNGLFFDERDLELAIADADPQLYEIATTYIDQRFPAAAMSLSTRVRIIIAHLLVEGDCTHERVAAALSLHLRTLQRRLRDEGESFETIKDSVRRDIALRYLRQSNVSLVKLTEILGYSETSVLSRSCHRWFAASPRKLRSELGAGLA
jgi:AraC-like DNA-binding protein